MKSLLRLLATTGLVASSSTAVIACTGPSLIPGGDGSGNGNNGNGNGQGGGTDPEGGTEPDPGNGGIPTLPEGEEFEEPEIPDGFKLENSGMNKIYNNVVNGILNLGTLKMSSQEWKFNKNMVNKTIVLGMQIHRTIGKAYISELHQMIERFIQDTLEPIEFYEDEQGQDKSLTFPIYENQFTYTDKSTKTVVKVEPGWFTINYKIELK